MIKDKHSITIKPVDLDGRTQVWIEFPSGDPMYPSMVDQVLVVRGFKDINITAWVSGDRIERVTKRTLKY